MIVGPISARLCLLVYFIILSGASVFGELSQKLLLVYGHYNSCITFRTRLIQLSDDERAAIRKHTEHELNTYGDLMTVVEVVEATGYCDTSLHRWYKAKNPKAFYISGRFLIPKISLSDFLVSKSSFDIMRKTWKQTLIIKSFLDMLQHETSINAR